MFGNKIGRRSVAPFLKGFNMDTDNLKSINCWKLFCAGVSRTKICSRSVAGFKKGFEGR